MDILKNEGMDNVENYMNLQESMDFITNLSSELLALA